MNAHSAFLEPLDVWSFRGNKLFGDAGSWGAALMPPPPSVVAGAVRSALLSRDRVDLGAFARGEVNHWQLGTPQAPGAFVLADLHPARKQAGCVEPLFPLPADLVPSDGAAPSALRPVRVHASLRSSAPLPMLPVLAQTVRSKPGKGRWLTAGGMQRWLAGQAPEAEQVEEDSMLWLTEERVGVALEAERRRAEDGKLFSLETVSCCPGVGLGVRVYGADLTPCVVRLGGDGRGARLEPIAIDWPEPDFEALARAGRMRL
ncbi:MAG: type III-B CRISPR module-associated protein Cmr3, partial [Casimicrobiaceae bacterium]|nr:type III-B CRISPR module-associated protein Cmr3 [Casimicrobiaceae bacterium]